MIFTEDRGIDFRINTTIDLVGASAVVLLVKYPDNSTDTLTCSVYDETNGIIRYITSTSIDELDMVGVWYIQARITFATGEVYHGKVVAFTISEVLIPTV